MEGQKEFNKENNPNFFMLWERHCKDWYDYNVYATTTKDIEMRVWNGNHPYDENVTTHVCRAGTRVRIWTVSRFGDVGITDNLENPRGYDARGIDADNDLVDYEFVKLREL